MSSFINNLSWPGPERPYAAAVVFNHPCGGFGPGLILNSKMPFARFRCSRHCFNLGEHSCKPSHRTVRQSLGLLKHNHQGTVKIDLAGRNGFSGLFFYGVAFHLGRAATRPCYQFPFSLAKAPALTTTFFLCLMSVPPTSLVERLQTTLVTMPSKTR